MYYQKWTNVWDFELNRVILTERNAFNSRKLNAIYLGMPRGLSGVTFNIALNNMHKTTHHPIMGSKHHKGNPMLRDEKFRPQY